jgi:hypothetical protein
MSEISPQQPQQGNEAGSGGSSDATDASGQNVGGGADTSKRVSAQEVQQVQNLIERCMQQYLPQVCFCFVNNPDALLLNLSNTA